jgi:hypothetical protein
MGTNELVMRRGSLWPAGSVVLAIYEENDTPAKVPAPTMTGSVAVGLAVEGFNSHHRNGRCTPKSTQMELKR